MTETISPTRQYLALLDATEYLGALMAAMPAVSQQLYLGALIEAMPAMSQQEYLDTVFAVVRRHHPDAVQVDVSSQDSPLTGFFLNGVWLADGHFVIEDDEVMPVYNDTWPLLAEIAPGGVIGEDSMGHADIRVPGLPC